MPHATTHRILFIDAYDSFTNNIIALLETHLRVSVSVIKIDAQIPDFPKFLRQFSAVIAGPGPGDPRKSKDVGWIRELWKLEGKDLLPVLGICLGFQSLVLAFGGTIDRLREPRHGIVRRVRGTGEGIFKGLEEVETVQYHSLYASLGPEDKLEGTGGYDSGKLSVKCSDLRPLAWDYETDNVGDGAGQAMSSDTRRILMAVEHRSKPLVGIQFHAESICSDSKARKVLEAWWKIARMWRRPIREIGSLSGSPNTADLGVFQIHSTDENPLPNYKRVADDSELSLTAANAVWNRANDELDHQQELERCNGIHRSPLQDRKYTIRVITSVIDVGKATVPSICETLGLANGEVIILDSELHQRRDVGEHSIIGLVSPKSLRLEYQVGTNEVRRIYNGQTDTINLQHCGGKFFSYLKSFMGQYKVHNSGTAVPFWGGLMGFISYEACLETIGVVHSQCQTAKSSERPDLSFVFVERSIVIEHSQQKIHVQTIKPDDRDWVNRTISRLKGTGGKLSSSTTPYPLPSDAQISRPNAKTYKSKVRSCQSAIRAGDSYELCLTNQGTVQVEKCPATWPMYMRLRSLNAAPFSAYVRLGKLTLLSSSPERFLQWSRPTQPSNPITDDPFDCEEKIIRCQFRPIKGTVQRQPDPNLPSLTLAEATALLATPKERAENLMIVDLIRHDLHGVVGSGKVSVPKLMVVEEYATLFQLVSVIEGSLVIEEDHDEATSDDDTSCNDPVTPNASEPIPNPPAAKSGLDILAASLPPGSMTGAPKLRSCQLLHSLEQRPRGIYSGVLGYLDVGGGGDFSVVIRTAVRWDRADGEADGEPTDEAESKEAPETDEWTIGAGGAVTSLSTEEGEWEEMCAKMRSTLRLFEGPYPAERVGIATNDSSQQESLVC